MRVIAQRLERLEQHLASGLRLTTLALILTTSSPPSWVHRLDASRAVVLIGPDGLEHRRLLARLRRSPDADLGDRVLTLDLRAGATDAVLKLVSGDFRETCVLGARGDGKSVSVGGCGLVLYAARHRAQGGALPVRVLVPSRTFADHRDKLIPTLGKVLWRGLWQSRDDGHLWVASLGGVEYVHLILFGVEHAEDQDKLRAEAHGVWVEEAAPAGIEASGGLTEDALGIAITSLRLPSYHHPVLVTSNYGSEQHWTWQRYAVRQHPGTCLIRIPPGERASEADRAVWAEALDGRPDLLRRLIQGEPALIVQGQAVLEGVWNPDLHVSREPLVPVRWARTMLGHDTGLRPATVVVQEVRGQLRVLASLVTEHGGMRQHISAVVMPWLERHGLLTSVMLEHRIDPAGTVGDFGNSDESPERVIRHLLRGPVGEGPVKWAPRIEPLLTVLGQLVNGQPRLVVAPGPDTAVLREACAGKWYYPRRADGSVVRELPEKNHPHSDVADALCYAVAALAPRQESDDRLRPVQYARSSLTTSNAQSMLR